MMCVGGPRRRSGIVITHGGGVIGYALHKAGDIFPVRFEATFEYGLALRHDGALFLLLGRTEQKFMTQGRVAWDVLDLSDPKGVGV
jgi:hypothetical protein